MSVNSNAIANQTDGAGVSYCTESDVSILSAERSRLLQPVLESTAAASTSAVQASLVPAMSSTTTSHHELLPPDGQLIVDYHQLVWTESGRHLPPGVNGAKLEAHLSEAQFVQVLGMGRHQFYALSKVDQMRVKQDVGLF